MTSIIGVNMSVTDAMRKLTSSIFEKISKHHPQMIRSISVTKNSNSIGISCEFRTDNKNKYVKVETDDFYAGIRELQRKVFCILNDQKRGRSVSMKTSTTLDALDTESCA
jgi:ribosome-associated translation inhibitor RaiA